MKADYTATLAHTGITGLVLTILTGNLFAAAIVVSPGTATPRTVGENSQTIAFTAVLDEAPTSNVVVTLISSDPGAATVVPTELTFSNTTWDTVREVLIRGTNDGDTVSENLTVSVQVDPARSDDAFDNAATQTISVTVIDDEAANGAPGPSNVLVVYNANWPLDSDADGVNDSLQVARYYAAKRGVPATNVLGLACSTGSADGYTEDDCNANWSTVFYPEVVEPIWDRIVQLGQTNIRCILLCYGVPFEMYRSGTLDKLRSVDNALMSLENLYDSPGANPITIGAGIVNTAYSATRPTFEADVAHFDHGLHSRAGKKVYLVSRIDGPGGTTSASYGSLQRALETVDQCLYADKYVSTNSGSGYYSGTGYVDTIYTVGGERYTHSLVAMETDVHTGAYGTGDEPADLNIAYGARFIDEAGLDLKWENTSGANRIGTGSAKWRNNSPATAAPHALLYGGWYSPFDYVDAFDWLPGSVGVDLNPYSLMSTDLRTGATYWGPRAMNNGLTCVSGVLRGSQTQRTRHARPNILMYYLLRGYCFAEASTLATPVLEWTGMNIGDPLYNPMQRGKTILQDTNSPVIATNYPYTSLGAVSNDWTVNVMADDSAAPEVVLVGVEYGTTTNYGSVASQDKDGYYRRHHVTLTNLLPGTTYHYRVVMTDPVGNTTISGDYTLNTTETAPQITSDPVSNALVGVEYVYQPVATASPTPFWRLTQSPTGMTVNLLNGYISWLPDGQGDFGVTLVASNGVAPAAVQSWTIHVPDPDDIDEDGLPNSWELQYFGGETNAVPDADDDTDGLDNYAEWLAGTVPTNGDSYFHISDVESVGVTNEHILRWTSISNRLYGVSWSTNLTNSFLPLASNLPATPSLNSYTDTQHTAESPVYYRISVKKQ